MPLDLLKQILGLHSNISWKEVIRVLWTHSSIYVLVLTVRGNNSEELQVIIIHGNPHELLMEINND